jgi:crotonobetainyl-CoA:carnitine CoA-transferase CaiB-like acyl-CoA transferase
VVGELEGPACLIEEPARQRTYPTGDQLLVLSQGSEGNRTLVFFNPVDQGRAHPNGMHGWRIPSSRPTSPKDSDRIPSRREWARLVESEAFARLARDGRFASEQLRQDNDELLPTELGKIFGEQTAREWEEMLLPRGGPCVEVTETVSHEYM